MSFLRSGFGCTGCSYRLENFSEIGLDAPKAEIGVDFSVLHCVGPAEIPMPLGPFFGTGKRGHYERGLFTGEISRISKISKFARISRNGRILLCFPQSGGSLESLESLHSLESLENGPF